MTSRDRAGGAEQVLKPPAAPGKPPRPRDAGSILLIDKHQGRFRVLVGKRSSRHVFMPDLHVFPGGRCDSRDYCLPYCDDLHPAVLDRLTAGPGSRTSEARMRAVALATVRELSEETGLILGAPQPMRPGPLSFLPDLSKLRYIARAITPPGHPRRFDTRFFTAFAGETEIDLTALKESDELDDLRWIDVNEAPPVKIPDITGIVLGELRDRLAEDPSLPFGSRVPFYYMRRGRFVRDLI